MTERLQIYKCNICGNIVEVLHPGKGQLVCCGQPMELLIEKTEEKGKEKHVPIVESKEGSIKVRVGEILHPMETEHFIEWIEIISDDTVYRKFLKAKDRPEFEVRPVMEKIKARAYCNIHLLWESH